MKYVVYGLFLLLVVLHQDFWWWETHEPLILGFIPIGLAWHAGISISAAILGYLAIKFCWPEGVDDELDPSADADTPATHPSPTQEHA